MTSKYLILIKFISLILLIGACSSPNYINKNKMNNLKLSSDIQYFIDEKFKPNSINSICVGKIINKANKQKQTENKKIQTSETPKKRKRKLIEKSA